MTITSDSFNARALPTDVTRQILNAGLSAAPFWSSLTPRPTSAGSVVMLTGQASGFDWTPELGEIPAVDPGDSGILVVPAKIAGRVLLSNEAIGDSEFPIADEVGRLIAESMAPTADTTMLYGDDTNPAAPDGIMDALSLATGSTLRAAVVNAAAAIMAAGGTPTHVLLAPDVWAEEMTRREETPTAVGPLFADLGLPNLNTIVAATLEAGDGLVLDANGCFAVTRSDFSIEYSDQSADAWTHDGVSLRVKARIAAAIPAPAKSARAIAVGS